MYPLPFSSVSMAAHATSTSACEEWNRDNPGRDAIRQSAITWVAPWAFTSEHAPASEPPVAAPPAAAARESEPDPIPAAEPPPIHPVRPSARHAASPSEPGAEEAEPSERPHHTHATASHTDRHHASPDGDKTDKSPESETSPASAKPARGGKRAPEDDPDGTMAPSIE